MTHSFTEILKSEVCHFCMIKQNCKNNYWFQKDTPLVGHWLRKQSHPKLTPLDEPMLTYKIK